MDRYGIPYSGRPAFDAEGGQNSFIRYYASHDARSYEAKTEQTLELRHAPVSAHHKHSPPTNVLYKDQGGVDKPLPVMPWRLANDRAGKASHFSPKVHSEWFHGRSQGSPENNVDRDSSPLPKDRYYSTHDYEYNKRLARPYHIKEEDHNKANGHTSPAYTFAASTQPSKGTYDQMSNNRPRVANPPSKDQHHSTHDYENNIGGARPSHLKEGARDHEKHKGNGYTPPAYAAAAPTQQTKGTYYQTSYEKSNDRPRVTSPYHLKEENHNNYEEQKGNGYASPAYKIPASTDKPTTETYHERSNNRPRVTSPPPRDQYYNAHDYGNNKGGARPSHLKEGTHDHDKNKGNGYSPPAYTIPAPSQPTRDTYYQAPYEKSSERARMTMPPPIITKKRETSRGVMLVDEDNGSPVRQQPQTKAIQTYQETIDSAEARRRYARSTPQPGAYAEEKYIGKIDCRQAAIKYGGVFVP